VRPALALLALLLAPSALAATIPASIQGAGQVTTYYIVTGGTVVQGGAFDSQIACYGCYVRLSIASGTFLVVENGQERALGAGTWEIRGFAGAIGITQNAPHDFFVEIHGAGQIGPYAPVSS